MLKNDSRTKFSLRFSLIRTLRVQPGISPSSDMSSSKVAIITGGASGFGLAVTEALTSKGWTVHIFDLNQAAGSAVASRLPKTIFHEVDVTSWPSLSSAFDAAFRQEDGRLDFVFANAGILEKGDFYERRDVTQGPPPEPKDMSIEINLKGVIATSYLAQHYFRANRDGGKGAVLVMTSSIVGLVSRPLRVYTKETH